MDLLISNVVNVSVSQTPTGIGAYNTSNVGLLTHEPYSSSFGTDPYKLYYEPTSVAQDFGTSSLTYAIAVALFSQQPNILAGGGYLAVMPILPESMLLTLSQAPDAGQIVLNFGGSPTAPILFGDTLTQIQAKIRAIPGLGGVVVSGSLAALTIKMIGLYGEQTLITTSGNTLTKSAVAVTATVSEPLVSESVLDAVNRTKSIVQYFGIVSTLVLNSAQLTAAATGIQALDKIMFVISNTPADVEVGGLLDLLRSGNFDHTRALYYGNASTSAMFGALGAYVGRALSTNFSGSLTTQTIHLKDLSTVQPDASMTDTLLAKAKAAGADIYGSIQGVAKVLSSGANRFFDQVYNQLWFVGAIKVAGFNFLAQTGSKIPQTETGMDGLRKSYRDICEQAVANGYAAPGTWNSPTTFGNQADFIANIKQKGYYIYSVPVSQQSAADRSARKAPAIQIAIKEAGAIHSSDVIVNINA